MTTAPVRARRPRVVVVGSGVAGLVTALSLGDGIDVVVVTKSGIDEGSTRYAQGGIAAAVMPGDSVAAHVADTLAAGAGLSDAAAVQVLCEEGPARIRDLLAWGVAFDRAEAAGDAAEAAAFAGLEAGLEGAHSFRRILHAGGDATGLEVETALVRAVRDSAVRVLEHTMLLDLLTQPSAAPAESRQSAAPGGESRQNATGWRESSVGSGLGEGRVRVTGVRVLREGRVEEIEADAVVLASGGVGQLYGVTTNPAVSTGDGAAAALRAGAALADVEFVQFHPTVLAAPDPFLVSEAVRGDGAVLRNGRGERFLRGVHPLAELAPRDVVARAIAAEMLATGAPVVLDATAIDDLASRFPTITAACRAAGYDWQTEPVPVAPAAHYWMGGVATDLDGRTTLPGLMAVGEVACTGVHGANRLASNSLLESLVFARRAARALRDELRTGRRDELHSQSGISPDAALTDVGIVTREPTRDELHALIWRQAGLLRTAEGLRSARAELDRWHIDTAGQTGTAGLLDRERLETANLLQLARVVVASALAREESRGAHARTDFPEASPLFAEHLVVRRGRPIRPYPVVAEAVAEMIAEPSTARSTKTSTEPSAARSTETSTEPSAERPTEPPTEPPVLPLTPTKAEVAA